ncbi:MAG: tRNA(Glu) U13 pseudouridine synthase TruD [Candidatus Woesearchaeota archaeon]|jgi:tRNA(Glu) U13 pseudouridine synthase TruD
MYDIKKEPTDFIVEEIIDITESSGDYILVKMQKTNMNTLDALDTISKHCNINVKEIGYCGLKDKNAVTIQFISLPKKASIANFEHEYIKLTPLHEIQRPLFIGNLVQNKFTITVHNIHDFEITQPKAMINYFGEQRFSTDNEQIGRHIIKKEYLKAAQLLARTQQRVQKALALEPTNGPHAMQQLAPGLLGFFIHAYQSYLWNRGVSIYVKEYCETYTDDVLDIEIPKEGKQLAEKIFPLIGFSYDEDDYSQTISEIVTKLMDEEKISERNFIIKISRTLTKEGDKREIQTPIENLHITGKSLTFTLNKGCYATVALRHILLPK